MSDLVSSVVFSCKTVSHNVCVCLSPLLSSRSFLFCRKTMSDSLVLTKTYQTGATAFALKICEEGVSIDVRSGRNKEPRQFRGQQRRPQSGRPDVQVPWREVLRHYRVRILKEDGAL